MSRPLRPEPLRITVVATFCALVVLGLAWELWLAPLRPGGSMLALKVLPLVAALPALVRGRVRAYQLWSMGVLLYLCEGVVRAMTERGVSSGLALLEIVLATIAFAAILGYVRAVRAQTEDGSRAP